MIEEDETRHRAPGVPPGVVGVMASGPRSARRLLRYAAVIEGAHPAQPYWYLEVVGVDPTAWGLGVGTRLLEPILALADKAAQPCYLETMVERNVAWYRSLGFDVREAGARFISGGLPDWTTMRQPFRTRAERGRRSAGSGERWEAAS